MKNFPERSSILFILCKFNLSDSFPFFLQILPFLEVSFSHLPQVLLKQNFSFLAIFSFFLFLKDVSDVIFELFRVSYVNELQSVLNCNAPSSGNIIHQKLH